MRAAVITPVDHLPNVKKLIDKKLGDNNVYYLQGKVTEGNVVNFVQRAKIDTLICNPNEQQFKIGSRILSNGIKRILTCSTGLNHIDMDWCKLWNIEVLSLTNDHDLLQHLPSTAELAFGLTCDLLRNITKSSQSVIKGEWSYTPYVGRQMRGMKAGIIGYGRLGSMMANYFHAFGIDVYIYDRDQDIMTDPTLHYNNCTLEKMFTDCDVISLHVHVNDTTIGMVNKELINKSKKGFYLINTSRGEIVKEPDVVDGLKSGKILGYGTDVLEDEFGDINDSPIVNAARDGHNVIITPHIGGMTFEGQEKAYTWAINKL